MNRASTNAANKAGGVGKAWRLYVAVGVLATAAYFLPSLPVPHALYEAIGFSAVLATIAGAHRNAPAHPASWYLLACGVLSMVAGDLIRTFYNVLEVTLPYPSVADVLHLSGYPPLAAGLAVMVYARAPGEARDDAGIIDAGILAMGAGMLSWVFLASPYTDDPSLSLPGVAVTVSYPLADVLLLAVLARLMCGGEFRTPAYYLLAFGVLIMLVSDVVYTQAAIAGTYQSGDLLDAGWLLSYVCFGAAALHPSMGTPSTPTVRAEVRVSPHRLVLLAASSLTAPIALLIQSLRGDEIDVPVIFGGSVALFLLVSLRIAVLARELKRGETRFRQLFEQSVDAVFVINDETREIMDCNAEACRSLGYAREEMLTLALEDFASDVLSEEEKRKRDANTPWRRAISGEPGATIGFHRNTHRRKDGTTFPVEVGVGSIDYGGRRFILGSARDITARKELEDRLSHQVSHDALTGLPNRVLFTDRLRHALASRKEESLAVLFLDLDNFKNVNDSLGHAAGDRLLKEVAERLSFCVRPGDTVARLGGDEFAVLIEDVADAPDSPGADESAVGTASRVSERILESLDNPVALEGKEVRVRPSIGIATGIREKRPDELLKKADLAMYTAKRRGKGRYEFYDPVTQ